LCSVTKYLGRNKIVTENDNTDIVGFQVESHALQAGAELNHLLGLKMKSSKFKVVFKKKIV
jgi:hypothetical protein